MHFISAKTLLSKYNGINIYRGCQHGCIYCDSRSDCYQMNHVFEDIEVKENALELLEKALISKRQRCMIGTGSMSDPYMPLEGQLCYTQKALELILHYGFGVTVITKSDFVLRDIDLFNKINEKAKAVLQMTLTTADDTLCKIIEPNVSVTSKRVKALKEFNSKGIPTVVWLDPFLPYINDNGRNVSTLIDMCLDCKVKGIINFGIGLTLRNGNREYFYKKLDQNFPGLKDRYIKEFGNSYEIMSPNNIALMDMFHQKCEKGGIMHNNDEVFRYLSTFPIIEEPTLF